MFHPFLHIYFLRWKSKKLYTMFKLLHEVPGDLHSHYLAIIFGQLEIYTGITRCPWPVLDLKISKSFRS